MKTYLFLLLTAITGLAYSQEILTSAGGNFETSGVFLSWTLGEPVIETFSSGNNNLTQGFQQTKLVITPVFILATAKNIKVYPNPTIQFVFIEPGNFAPDNSIAELFTFDGKQLNQTKITGPRTKIDVSKYPNGTYFLKISNGETLLNSFKLIKAY